MTMYLPNTGLRPTGFEPAEFIEVPPMAGDVISETRAPPERPEDSVAQLTAAIRHDITQCAHEYIAGLVADHHGDPSDVRSVIHDLSQQRPDWGLPRTRSAPRNATVSESSDTHHEGADR